MKTFMNDPRRCAICFKGPKNEPMNGEERNDPFSKPHRSRTEDEENKLMENAKMVEVPLVGHHVSYFPEKIAFVHYECHKVIHETPLTTWIQYNDGDARKFYEGKRQ